MFKPQYEIILYVADQERSKKFYTIVLGIRPNLDVPGMTEFVLSDYLKLGLMPENGISMILLDKAPHPSSGNGIPRCELYILLEEIEEPFKKGISAGAKEISAIQNRDWGHSVGYLADPDGHIIAFAKRID